MNFLDWFRRAYWVPLLFVTLFLGSMFVVNLFEQSYRENLCRNLSGIDLEENYITDYPPFSEFVKGFEEKTDSDIRPNFSLGDFAIGYCANDECSEFETIGCIVPARLCHNDMNGLLCYEVVLDFDYDLQDWKEWSKGVELFYK